MKLKVPLSKWNLPRYSYQSMTERKSPFTPRGSEGRLQAVLLLMVIEMINFRYRPKAITQDRKEVRKNGIDVFIIDGTGSSMKYDTFVMLWRDGFGFIGYIS